MLYLIMSPKLTAKKLKKMGVPKIYWAGLIVASILGLSPLAIQKYKSFRENPGIFSKATTVESVTNGDTFVIKNGMSVRMIGINAPDRGEKNYDKSKVFLEKEINNKEVYLEYDRYPDDEKNGKLLAWVWIDCEETPKFLPADYMHKSNNESMPGLVDNPEGCKNGKLVNEELVKSGFAKPVVYKDRGPTKYQERISKISP
jgi:endonuclease YncB( thermonuclease family)